MTDHHELSGWTGRAGYRGKGGGAGVEEAGAGVEGAGSVGRGGGERGGRGGGDNINYLVEMITENKVFHFIFFCEIVCL